MNDTAALGTESIKNLFWKMTIPAVAAQVISLLYNIVDRIYIGHMPDGGSAPSRTAFSAIMPMT